MPLTTSDLKSIEVLLDKKLDQKLDQKLKPIKKTLNLMQKDLDWVIGKYDSRLNHLEKH